MHTFIKNLLNGQSVEWKSLGEVAVIKTGQSISKQKILDNQGIYPVINSGKEPLGYIDEWNTENDPIGITSRGAGVGSIIWQEGKYFRGNLNYSATVKDKEILNVRFLYYVLVNFQKTIHSLCNFTGIPALNASELKKLIIPVPPLPVQQKIVQILDAFTATTAELTAELTAERTLRQKQYQYYRDKLLNFSDNVEWKSLGEIAHYSKSRISYENLDENNYVGVDNLLPNKQGKTLSNHIPEKGNVTAYFKDDILIGNIRPYLKKIWQANNDGGASGDVLVIHLTDNSVNSRYLYQVLSDDKFFAYNMQHAKGAKMPRGSKEMILDYTIPIPPLETQAQIVEILDKFETLTHSISEGLPREIELRQKQYEYYRALLLGFE